ncbi:MAG: hypothetical protein HY537_18440 [Deltaproteobacteria bacterium]|nr:hypothetical protein [Deltaproteobacteria bacterium]
MRTIALFVFATTSTFLLGDVLRQPAQLVRTVPDRRVPVNNVTGTSTNAASQQNDVEIVKKDFSISSAEAGQIRSRSATDGENFFVIWEDARFNESSLFTFFGALIGSDGKVKKNDIPISTPSGSQRTGSIAFNGSVYLVVWSQIDEYYFQVRGAIFDKNAVRVKDLTFNFGEAVHHVSPVVMAVGTDFGLVWATNSSDGMVSVQGALVNSSGDILSRQVIVPSQEKDISRPKLASKDNTLLVVWEERGGSGKIKGALFSKTFIRKTDDLTLTSGEFNAGVPTVTAGKDQYLVVWEDTRNNETDLYGARIAPDGTVLDANGIAISTAEGPVANANVVWTGKQYTVVFAQPARLKYKDELTDEKHIFAVNVGNDGTVDMPVQITGRVPTHDEQDSDPWIAWNGSKFLVTWSTYNDPPSYFDLYGVVAKRLGHPPRTREVVLKESGRRIRGLTDFLITTGPGNKYSPSVASDGEDFLVVWEDSHHSKGGLGIDIYGAQVDNIGRLKDPSIPIATKLNTQRTPKIVSSQGRYLVIWINQNSQTASGAILNRNGLILKQMENMVPDFKTDNMAIVGLNDGFATFFADDQGISLLLLDSHGNLIRSRRIVNEDGAYPGMAAARHGQNVLLVWESTTHDIRGVMLSDTGQILKEPYDISASPTLEQRIDAIGGDDGFLVVWEDAPNGAWQIYGARLSSSGEVLDPNTIVIATAVSANQFPSDPAVTWFSGKYRVVWTTFFLSKTCGGTYPLVWNIPLFKKDCSSTYQYQHEIYSSAVRSDGTVEAPYKISSESKATMGLHSSTPALTPNKHQLLIAWKGERKKPQGDKAINIYGAFRK